MKSVSKEINAAVISLKSSGRGLRCRTITSEKPQESAHSGSFENPHKRQSMLRRSCSWHNEYYRKALRTLHNRSDECIGWLDWIERNHPETYIRFERALRKIHQLWGDMSPEAMEDFKKAVKAEINAIRWAVQKFLKAKDQEKQAA
jgi:hypothetical protein